MSLSELMTIVIMLHRSGYRTFKHYYIRYVREFWQQYFPPTSFILPIENIETPSQANNQAPYKNLVTENS